MRKSRQSTLRRVDYSMHFFCSDSGDWGHPSASNARRCHGFPWERIAVLAEVEFCPLGASMFPSHQALYFCSLVVQGIASVLVNISVGVIGAELLSSYVSQPSIFKIVMRGYRACWVSLCFCVVCSVFTLQTSRISLYNSKQY